MNKTLITSICLLILPAIALSQASDLGSVYISEGKSISIPLRKAQPVAAREPTRNVSALQEVQITASVDYSITGSLRNSSAQANTNWEKGAWLIKDSEIFFIIAKI